MTRKSTAVPTVGGELRRLRIAAGLSMSELAERIQFSKGYISKVETGQKSPSLHFVRTADAALATGGLLTSLTEEKSTTADAPPQSTADPVPAARSATTPEVTDLRAAGGTVDEAEARYSLTAFAAILEQLRNLGQTLDPATVVEMLKPHIAALRELATRSDGTVAEEALRLAAHFADFTSWMTQETGDDANALRWIDVFAALADEVGDRDMAANSYLRRANIALYQQDAYGTITFARQARAIDCSPRIKDLAALREAQGHALAGDYENFSACLDRAVALEANSAEERSGSPTIGPRRIADPVALAKGWSLFDLGRSAEAIEVLEPLLARTPKERHRAWARVASRLALALASVREVDRACELTKDILALSAIIRSATIRSDLRQLSRMLNRWSFDPAVQNIMPHLSAALLPTAGGQSAPPPAAGK